VQVLDTTPPVISQVSISRALIGSTLVKWTTNEPADSQIEYGTTVAYGSTTTLDARLVVSHAQVLSGLARRTLYHYRVLSRDAAGNLAVSGDLSFMNLR